MKKILKRIIVFLFVFILIMPTVRVYEVKASPLVVAGVEITAEVIAYVASLLAAAGITFNSQNDMNNAVTSFVTSNPSRFANMWEYRKAATEATVAIGVSALKNIFDEAVNYFIPYTQGGISNQITTANSVKFGFYEGYPVYDYFSFGNGVEARASSGGMDSIYYQYKTSARANYGNLTGLGLGKTVTNGIGNVDIVSSSFGVYKNSDYCIMTETTCPNSLYAGSRYNFYYTFKNLVSADVDYTYIYVHQNSYMYLACINYYDIVFENGNSTFVQSKLALVEETGLFCRNMQNVSFTGSLADINVMNDTKDYAGTIGAIGNILGKTLTGTDTVGVRVLDDPVAATREAVIVGVATDVPIDPPIDEPIDPPIDVPVDMPIDFSGLKMEAAKLTTVFPFCIPFDFVSAIKGMVVAGKPPVFVMDFSGTMFGNYKWELNLADYESLAKVVRWCVWIGFFIGLIMSTRKFIRW